ncbi:MAG TPA: hypothetical protein VMP68_18700 [Candidatus Eisenbacteria bacterium]|nr:hypothetical protein [Candidatus Eisenbacteria bacterium]
MSRQQKLAPVLMMKTQVTLLEPVLPTFTLDVQKRLVTVRFTGPVTFDDIARYAKSLLAHQDFQPTFSEIADLREVSELNLQANEFLKLADKIDPFWPEAKRAFVVETAVQNHAARMHKILRSDRKIEIFQSLEEAEKWIAAE